MLAVEVFPKRVESLTKEDLELLAPIHDIP